MLYITNNSIRHPFAYTELMVKDSYYVQFNVSLLSALFKCQTCILVPYIRPLSGATSPSQSVLGSDGKETVLHIPISSKTKALPLYCLMAYTKKLLWGSYPSAKTQSLYSTALHDWDGLNFIL